MKSIYTTKTPEETMELGLQLVSRLIPGTVVLLYGDLGSGKTHFVKGIAQGFGIEEVIKSPTFAYVNKYEIESDINLEAPNALGIFSPQLTLYHYDLYRLKQGDAFNSIGLEDTLNDPHAINVIEWADRLEGFLPKNHIRIDFTSGKKSHELSFDFHDTGVVPETLVEKYWNDWSTPLHVRDHCRQVAKVALQIGQAFIDQNVVVDLNMLNTAALLHDMARVVDFREMNRSKFHEEITEEKWGKWLEQRNQFNGMHHAEVACGALFEDGYYKTAEIIRMHNTLSILEEPERFGALEIAIIYYADKRVQHTQLVDLKERFHDGQIRNSKGDKKMEKLYQEAYKRQLELEKNLFEPLSILPNQIVGS